MDNTKTRREAAALVVVVFLLGALVGGLAMHVWTSHAYSVPKVPHGPDQVIQALSAELNLSPDQLKSVTAIVDETHTQIRALYAPLDPQREQIRQQAREHIRAVLTPEQKPKFEDFLRRLDDARKKEERR